MPSVLLEKWGGVEAVRTVKLHCARAKLGEAVRDPARNGLALVELGVWAHVKDVATASLRSDMRADMSIHGMFRTTAED